ncbi:MAG: methyltransferase domain-containing protein [Pseudomonadota bacterium]
MSRVTFENYATLSRAELPATQIAGRYHVQAEAERRIVPDVVDKLAIAPDDALLEIGCGVGALIAPLSYLVRSAAGVDHPDVLAALRRRIGEGRVETLPGNFLDLEISGAYSKILVYSVLHCLSDGDEAMRFIQKAAGLLRPGGRLLLGDLPNSDRKARFQASPRGRAFEAEWAAARAADPDAPGPELQPDPDCFTPDDAFLLRILAWARGAGAHAYILPQPPDLPFGHTREDVVIEAPA